MFSMVEGMTRKRDRGVIRIAFFAVLSALLLVSVFGGPDVLHKIGLGFLSWWGSWVLWGIGLLVLSGEGRSAVATSSLWGSEWFLGLVLVLSLVLRWPMASLDLEHYVGPDEGQLVEGTLEMMKTGDFHQRHPGYPGLFFYLQMVPASAHLMFASARGEGSTIRDLPREGFYRIVRQMTLLAGWAAALVVYFVGRGWVGPTGAVLAASLVALSPLCFRESKVVNPDLLLMLFVTCGLGLCLRSWKEPKTSNFVAAGIGIGLAAAIKYTGAMLVAPYIVASWLSGRARRTAGPAVLGLVCSVVAFFVASPYSLLDLPLFFRGLGDHYGYYQAAQMNAPKELSRVLIVSGLGAPAAVAAFIGALVVLTRLEKQGLIFLSFPMAYLLLFSFFQRAYPRHAIVLLPSMAVLAAWAVGWCFRAKRHRWLSYGAFLFLVASPLLGTIRLGLAARRITPAEQARLWVEAEIPGGSRILEDQLTPRLDPERYTVHRLRVEEEVFVGNYDWVLRSGYPPGLALEGLRPVVRFTANKGLGSPITLYQVPDRETLMGSTLDDAIDEAALLAGHLPYFGKGWQGPSASAFGTTRLSRGDLSEIFFVLGDDFDAISGLEARLRAACALDERSIPVRVEINAQELLTIDLAGEPPGEYSFVVPRQALEEGLNRLTLHYRETVRLNRRHREAAIRFFSLELSKGKGLPEE
jgi:4-amino-4-deoxy-L-arabinose transferase-like glycosyltransferase